MIIVINSNGNKYPITPGMSAYALHKQYGLDKLIARSSFTELATGRSSSLITKQGVEWKAVTINEPERKKVKQIIPAGVLRANKVGITFEATKRDRKKHPVVVSITEEGKRYLVEVASRDMAVFLGVLKKHSGKEIQEIAEVLGWSRDTALIYKARAEARGHCYSWRKQDEGQIVSMAANILAKKHIEQKRYTTR